MTASFFLNRCALKIAHPGARATRTTVNKRPVRFPCLPQAVILMHLREGGLMFIGTIEITLRVETPLA